MAAQLIHDRVVMECLEGVWYFGVIKKKEKQLKTLAKANSQVNNKNGRQIHSFFFFCYLSLSGWGGVRERKWERNVKKQRDADRGCFFRPP